MSVVIVGGNDRMHFQYKSLCKGHNCKVKIFTQMPGNFKSQIGSCDLLILFTNTVSHKMACCAVSRALKKNITVERCHSSSSSALKKILEKYCKAGRTLQSSDLKTGILGDY